MALYNESREPWAPLPMMMLSAAYQVAQQAFKIPEGKHYCTISIGLAACQSKSLSEVMRKADKALYKAKDKQRNCVIAH